VTIEVLPVPNFSGWGKGHWNALPRPTSYKIPHFRAAGNLIDSQTEAILHKA